MGSKRRIRSYVPHLIPFWKATAYYFLLYFSESDCDSGWGHALIKLLPMMALITFVVLHGASLHGRDINGSSYSRHILWGLTFAAIGDILLVWKQSYFILGIIAFSMAHIMYTLAFGFERAQWLVGICLGVFAVLFWQYVSQFIKGIMVKAVLVYACIIATMAWRAIARIDQVSDLKDSWTKLCSCVGAILFTTSDICIALSQFVGKLKWSNQIIMSTYYLAQLGIALSVVDCQNKQRGMNLKRLIRKSTTMFKRNHHHRHYHDVSEGDDEVKSESWATNLVNGAKSSRSKSDGDLTDRTGGSEAMMNGTSGSTPASRSESFMDQLAAKRKVVSTSDISQDSLTPIPDFNIKTLNSSTTICTSYGRKRKCDTISKDK